MNSRKDPPHSSLLLCVSSTILNFQIRAAAAAAIALALDPTLSEGTLNTRGRRTARRVEFVERS